MSLFRRGVPRSINNARSLEHVVLLRGGLNLTASALEMADGECVQLDNYEVNVQGDYQSLTGFERFDGRPSPSAAKARNGPYLTDDEEFADLQIERIARRDAITPVPGSGPVRGIFYLDDHCYAFRDTEDGSSCKLWGSSENGWQEIDTPQLSPGGSLKSRYLNFPDRPKKEVIGVDGVNKGFLFDGSVFTQIDNAGMEEDDAPIAVEVLPSDIVVFAYRGGSLQYSALGNPESWDVAEGAGEIRVVDEIQEIALQANNSCAIFCRNRTYILYGRVPDQFDLTNLNTNTGAISGTVQTIGDSVYLDDRGITRLNRIQAFGNFNMTTMSQRVSSLLDGYRSQVAASVVIREKNQYRLFFKDGSGLITTFRGEELLGFSRFNLGGDRVGICACNAEDGAGAEVVFFGGTDGFVYQMERGTSFDGDEIVTVLRTAFSSFSSGNQSQIGVRKRVTRLTLEVKVVNDVELLVQPDFDYSDPSVPVHQSEQVATVGGGGFWDQATFNESFWSTAILFQAPIYTRGRGENTGVFIRTVSDFASPHIITSVVYRYVPLDRRR